MPRDVKESRPRASFYNGIDCCRKGGGGEATEEAVEGEEVVGECLNITLRNFCSPVMPKSASTAATSSWVAKVISTFTFGMSLCCQMFLNVFIKFYSHKYHGGNHSGRHVPHANRARVEHCELLL